MKKILAVVPPTLIWKRSGVEAGFSLEQLEEVDEDEEDEDEDEEEELSEEEVLLVMPNKPKVEKWLVSQVTILARASTRQFESLVQALPSQLQMVREASSRAEISSAL